MSVFGDYARCYDLLYADKDYAAEARYAKALLDRHCPEAASVLELGCGSGRHAARFAQMGLIVHGVDASADMLARAREERGRLPEAVRGRVQFSEGDLRAFRLGETFDAVFALFHVFSYQTTDADLQAAFATAAAHLRPGGILLFDCWYGPAVLAEPPAIRIKRAEDANLRITRLCEPDFRPEQNLVIVNYTLFIEEKATDCIARIEEQHPMRYLFEPEIRELLLANNLQPLAAGEWITGRPAGPDTFGVCFGGKRGD